MINQNNKYHNLCEIVLLPTNKEIKENDLVLIEKVFNYNLVSKNSTSLSESEVFKTNLLTTISRIDMKQNGIWCKEGYHITDLVEAGLVKSMNLYFTSDEKIEKGDWFIYSDKWLHQCQYILGDGDLYENDKQYFNFDCRKIIASTDTSLKKPVSGRSGQPCPLGLVDDDGLTYKSLPQPSNDFIKEYISKYNVNSYIAKVLVEYCLKGGTGSGYWLKVNNDNTINIIKQKESWTREEVIALHKLNCERLTNSYISSDIDWIEEKLIKIN